MAISDDKLRAEKALIRGEVKEAIGRMTKTDRRRLSSVIGDRVVCLPAWAHSDHLLVFSSTADEVDTGPLIRAARRVGKVVYLPRIFGRDIRFHLFASFGLERHPYGMLEPPPEAPLWSVGAAYPTPRRTVIICPGLAFDHEGMRLGRGKGYYDRFLATLHQSGSEGVTVIGICFDIQTIARVPSGPEDQRMDAVVTESRTIWASAAP